MKRFLIMILAFLLIFAFTISAAFAAGFSQNGDAIEKAADSVLQIAGFYADDPDVISAGSGFIAFNNRTLITNYHVIDGLMDLYAWDDDDEAYAIKYILCADKKADIAILEFEEPTRLQPLELYPDDKLKRGSPIVAIGSPRGGAKNTVTTGVISSQHTGDNGYPEIQISASITHGSSGGALFNDDGKVIGVTSSGYDGVDINFAINIAVAQAMYNAWDGSRYTFSNFKDTAKMDFTGVYDHSSQSAKTEPQITEKPTESPIVNIQASDTWTCPNCGSVNTDLFCQECGTEKPSWICACGRNNNGKFCGSCGKKAEELVTSLNSAIVDMLEHKYIEAIGTLEQLEEFESGSYSTSKGTHIKAKDIIPEAYYEWGLYLVSVDGKHNEILDCFNKAGNYRDSKEQIVQENDRYYGPFYNSATEKAENGEYEDAIRLYEQAGAYSDAKVKIIETYYAYGKSLLEEKNYEKSREAFTKVEDYLDSKTLILKTYYMEALEKFDENEYDSAIALLEKAGNYMDAKNQLLKVYYTEAVDKFNSGDYEAALELFTKAGSYSDAKEQILKIYYNEASEELENKNYNEAIVLFEKAGDYADSKEKISSIYVLKGDEARADGDTGTAKEMYAKAGDYSLAQQKLKELEAESNKATYDEAVKAMTKGEYSLAKKLFGSISGYSDADEMYIDATIGEIEERYNTIIADGIAAENKKDLLEYIDVLKGYLNIPKAELLYKKINYSLGKYSLSKSILLGDATIYFKRADDYEDAFSLYLTTKVKVYEGKVKQGKYTEAYEYYADNLVPDGYTQEAVLMNVGDKGKIVSEILDLVKALGNTKIPQKEDIYKEQYVKSVEKFEEYFGLQIDGSIVLSEYLSVKDIIFSGSASHKVMSLLEKLADLSYINKLDKIHTTYEKKYINSIKKAEKALGLTVDGIITPDEYGIIMKQDVEIAEPQNVTAKVNKNIVNISWSNVPGAVSYNVYMRDSTSRQDIIIASNVKTNKYKYTMDTTGVTIKIWVEAAKYTETNKSDILNVDVPIYYFLVSIADLVENYDDYVGQYVEMKNLTIDGWRIRKPNGSYSKTDLFTMKNTSGYDLCVLCKSEKGLVELNLNDYKLWGWKDDGLDPATLCQKNRLVSISGKGKVDNKMANWKNDKTEGNYIMAFYVIYGAEVPVINLESVSCRYR